jgi:hypothetical protein
LDEFAFDKDAWMEWLKFFGLLAKEAAKVIGFSDETLRFQPIPPKTCRTHG